MLGTENLTLSVRSLQIVYDRAYSNPGVMGTELDKGYSCYTKTRLLELCNGAPNKRLIDIGMGSGELWDYAEDSWKRFGLDLSIVGVRKGAASYPSLNALVGIAERIPFPSGFFGAAVAADTMEHVFVIQEALGEIRRILSPGGIVALSVPAPDSLRNWASNTFLRTLPSPTMLTRLLWVLIRRKWLFGTTTFQPIDRDLSLDDWINKLEASKFSINEVQEWPNEPLAPIVYLISAERSDD